jgi:hypothetical protein
MAIVSGMTRPLQRRRRALTVGVAGLALAGLAGCAQEVGRSEVEQSIREAMAGQQVMLESVTCPGGLPAEEDAVIICQVSVIGVDGSGVPIDRIRVRVTRIDGSEVRYRLEPLAEGTPDDAPADDAETTES